MVRKAAKPLVQPVVNPAFKPVTAEAGQTIQPPTMLSQSAIWTIMQHYYQTQGPEAFHHIPYFGTSNVPMADAYSDCILAYWSELPLGSPLTIIELAAGSGRLSFLVLTLLLEKRALHPKLADAPFTLVITDFAESSVASLEQHPQLQSFIALGVLDFAVVNPLADHTLTLRHSQKPLLAGPLVVMANYLFDSLPQDAYRVVKGQLFTTKLALRVKPDITINNAIPDIRQLDLDYTHHPVEGPLSDVTLYNNDDLDTILRQTASAHYNASFMLPVGALRTVQWMSHLSGGQWLLLASDKGSQRKETQLDIDTPDMVLHDGAFSFFVNFDSISQWFNGHQGQTLSCPVQLQQPLYTFIATQGLPLQHPHDPLPMTIKQQFGMVALTRAVPALLPILSELQPSQPSDFVQDQRQIEALLQGIRLSLCDPFIISRLTRVIYPLLASFMPTQCQDLLAMLNRAQQLYFTTPAEPLYPLSLGILLFTLGFTEKSIVVMRQAMQIEPQNAHVYLWLGKAYEQAHNPRKARDCYHNALVLDANLTDAQDRFMALTIILNERPTDSDMFLI